MKRFVLLIILLGCFLANWPASAQQRPVREQPPAQPQPPAEKRATPAAKPAAKSTAPPAATTATPQVEEGEVAFENLLDADLYLAYGEARNVGQQLTTGDVANLIQSVQKMDLLPAEVQPVLAFVNAHAAELAGTRLMFVAMRAAEDAKLPQAVVALEFTSAADAAKFEPRIRQFLRVASMLAGSDKKNAARSGQTSSASFYLQRKSNVLLLSDERFELNTLKKADGRSLAEDPNFQTVKTRLATEPLFFFVNTGQISRRFSEQMQRAEQRAREEQAKAAVNEKAGDAAAAPETKEPAAAEATPPETQIEPPPIVPSDPPPAEAEVAEEPVQKDAPAGDEAAAAPESTPAEGGGADISAVLPGMFGGMVFGGGGGMDQWPEAVGVGFAIEGESVVIRSLLTDHTGTAGVNPLPLVSFLHAGPSLALDAPSLMPDNTQMMISASLDVPQIFESFVKMTSRVGAVRAGGQIDAGANNRAEEEIAAVEKKFGFSIRRDLLPVLGPEVAVTLPLREFLGSAASKSAAEEGAPPAPGFLLYLSLRDKSAAQNLLPRVLEAFGMTQPGGAPGKEMVGDAELYSYPGVTLAFINNFLILATEPKDVRLAVEAFNRRQTLSGGNKYADATNWQPAQKIAQAYVSESLMADFVAQTKRALARADEPTRGAYAGFNPDPKPLTLAVSGDGGGVLHEIRVPKNLLTSVIARAAADSHKMPLAQNEDEAASMLRNLYYSQMQRFATDDKHTYATLDQLMKEEAVSPSSEWEKIGYRVEMSASGEKFEATATPTQYGTTGLQSYFIDETGVLRGADNGGHRATASDKEVAQ